MVVIHDEDVQITFIGKGLVKDYTLEQLKALRCRKEIFREEESCMVPTLSEVLDLLKKQPTLLNIEIKTD